MSDNTEQKLPSKNLRYTVGKAAKHQQVAVPTEAKPEVEAKPPKVLRDPVKKKPKPERIPKHIALEQNKPEDKKSHKEHLEHKPRNLNRKPQEEIK